MLIGDNNDILIFSACLNCKCVTENFHTFAIQTSREYDNNDILIFSACLNCKCVKVFCHVSLSRR